MEIIEYWPYRSVGRPLNKDNDMVRVVVNCTAREYVHLYHFIKDGVRSPPETSIDALEERVGKLESEMQKVQGFISINSPRT